jgi:hypothetical protein
VDAEFGRKLTEGLRKHAKSNIIASANLWAAIFKQTQGLCGTNSWF